MRRGGLNLRPIWIITAPYWLATRWGECTNTGMVNHAHKLRDTGTHQSSKVNKHTRMEVSKKSQSPERNRLENKRFKTWRLQCGWGFIQESHAYILPCIFPVVFYFVWCNCVVFWGFSFFVWSTSLCVSPHGPSDASHVTCLMWQLSQCWIYSISGPLDSIRGQHSQDSFQFTRGNEKKSLN